MKISRYFWFRILNRFVPEVFMQPASQPYSSAHYLDSRLHTVGQGRLTSATTATTRRSFRTRNNCRTPHCQIVRENQKAMDTSSKRTRGRSNKQKVRNRMAARSED